MINITKQQLALLIDEVILKYQHKCLVEHITCNDEKYRHDVLLTNFAVMFFDEDVSKLQDNFKDLLDFYSELKIPQLSVKNSLAAFFKKYKKWVENYSVADLDCYEKIASMYKDILNSYDFDNSVLEEDDFLFVADSGVDDSINNMHYNDEQKISATSYFALHPLDDMDIEDIVEAKKLLLELLDDYIKLTDEFLIQFASVIQKLNTTLQYTFATKEFRDIGMSLEKLFYILNQYKSADIEMQDVVFNILITFIEDLVQWLDNIFISQDAQDIHYLDASLLANVSQLEMVLEPTKEVEDDFLF
jgi:hypothetical protein